MKTVTLSAPAEGDEKLFRLEAALAAYRAGKISPGQAAQLAQMGRWEFADLAKSRGVITPYTSEMLAEDFADGRSH